MGRNVYADLRRPASHGVVDGRASSLGVGALGSPGAVDGVRLPPPPPPDRLPSPPAPRAALQPAPPASAPPRQDPSAHTRVIRSGDLGRGKKQWDRGRDRQGQETQKYDEIYRFVQPAQAASFKPFPASVAPAVRDLLTMGGTRIPYTHQADVPGLILDDHMNVSLRTPTASGKTVAFLAPTLTILLEDPKAVAIMLYPVNALAADQAKNLVDLGFVPDPDHEGISSMILGGEEITVGVLNGDIPEESRKIIRERARMILTNPVALHTSMLSQGNHQYRDGTSWNRVIRNTRMVVLDEAHLQNGVQGTQTALAFRRYLALAEAKGAQNPPQIILSTATIGNPIQHAEALTGLGNWASVDRSGAKTQERTIIVLNPAKASWAKDGRWPTSVVIQDLLLQEHLAGRKTITFNPSRASTDRLADRVNEVAGEDICIAFHSGLPKRERTEATDAILRGRVSAVATTSALEVGVDIGGMDTCILNGHPGDFASFGQRIGRVGRTSPGKVFLVLDENQNAVNTYLQSNPEALQGTPEARTVYPENHKLSTCHAACTYLETGKNLDLVQKYFPHVDLEEMLELSERNPYKGINMLGGIGDFGEFKAYGPGGEEIQRLGGQDAILNWHVGAVIRSFSGKSFQVFALDCATQRAATTALPESILKIQTSPTRDRQINILSSEPSVLIQEVMKGIASAISGDFDIKEQTIGYKKFSWEKGQSRPDREMVELSPEEMNPAIGYTTRGVEVLVSDGNALAEMILGADNVENICDALSDVLHKTLPIVVQARPEDVEIQVSEGIGGLTLQFFDVADGGMGWSEAAAPRLTDWLRAASVVLARCSCHGQGCPKCTLAPISEPERRALVWAINQAVSL